MKKPTTRQHKRVSTALGFGNTDSIEYFCYVGTRNGADQHPITFSTKTGSYYSLETPLDELVFAVIPEHYPFFGKSGLSVKGKKESVKRKTILSLEEIGYHPDLEHLKDKHSLLLFDSVEEGEEYCKIYIEHLHKYAHKHASVKSLVKQVKELTEQTEFFKRLAEESCGKRVLLNTNMTTPEHLTLASQYLTGTAKIPGLLLTAHLSEDPNQLYEQLQMVEHNGKSVSFVVTNYGSGSELERQAVIEFIHGKPYSAKADTSEKIKVDGQLYNKTLHGDEAFKKMISYVGWVPHLKLEMHKLNPYDGEHDLSKTEFQSSQTIQSYLLDRARIEDEYHSGRLPRIDLEAEVTKAVDTDTVTLNN